MFANEPPKEAQQGYSNQSGQPPTTNRSAPHAPPASPQHVVHPTATAPPVKEGHRSEYERPPQIPGTAPVHPPQNYAPPQPQGYTQTYRTGQPPAPTHGPGQPQYYPPPGGYSVGRPAAAVAPPIQSFPAVPRVPFVSNAPPPVAPPGFIYVLEEQMSPVALLLCILFFPLGILFLICLTQKYWVLYPAGPSHGYR